MPHVLQHRRQSTGGECGTNQIITRGKLVHRTRNGIINGNNSLSSAYPVVGSRLPPTGSALPSAAEVKPCRTRHSPVRAMTQASAAGGGIDDAGPTVEEVLARRAAADVIRGRAHPTATPQNLSSAE